MRIELPNASWAETVQRPDDDAHTLTVATQSASDWAPLQLLPDAQTSLSARTGIERVDPLVLTITL